MTEQPPPAPQEPTQESPPPAAPPPSSGWTAPPTAGAPAAAAGGLVYADVPNRAIAYIIDAIILFVINVVIGLVIGSVLAVGIGEVNYASVLVTTIIGLAINAVYFIYTWTSMRGSPGQKVLGMQVGNASDGATVTMDQAIRRWIFLGAPFGLASALSPIPALGLLIGLAGFAYFIYLLVSTAQSPTKQGFHDKQANTVVVKAARSVA